MEVTHKQEDLKGTVTVKVTKDDYLPKVNEQLKELRKKVTMRGFRPGHVPINLIKKLYGKEVLFDEVYKLVNQALLDFIKENKLKLIGDFIPVQDQTDFNPSEEKDYQFVYDYAVTTTPLINYEQITVPFYKVKITDEDLDKEIESILKQFGTYEESEEITDDKDIFYVTLIELDENGEPKQDGLKKDDIVLALDLIDEKLRDQFIGKKKDDEVVVKLSELVPDETRRAALLNLKPEELQNLSDNFKLIITQVKRFKEAELGEELYKKYAPGEEIKDEQQFREVVKKRLEQYFENEAKELFKRQVKDVLLSSVEVRIPEDFLLRWLKYRQESKPENERLSDEELEKQIPDLVKAIKWNRIIEQIAEDLDIKLEKKDSVRAHADYMKALYAQYGVDPNMLGDEFFMMQAEGEYDKMSEDQRYSIDTYAFENKVLEALLEKVNLDEREVTIDMFDAMLKEDSKEEKQETEEEKNKDEQQAQETGSEETSDKQEKQEEKSEEKGEEKSEKQEEDNEDSKE